MSSLCDTIYITGMVGSPSRVHITANFSASLQTATTFKLWYPESDMHVSLSDSKLDAIEGWASCVNRLDASTYSGLYIRYLSSVSPISLWYPGGGVSRRYISVGYLRSISAVSLGYPGSGVSRGYRWGIPVVGYL